MAKAYRARKKLAADYEAVAALGRAWRGLAGTERPAVVVAQARCVQCGHVIPHGKRANARYCGRACKVEAARTRRAARERMNDVQAAH
ncbi:hypothetical protein [Nonomuraea monospora]|uniref:hypothetical protein n=1 Tax=Nonomuraea monospora TaxID=568818 RepID=UPI0031E25783